MPLTNRPHDETVDPPRVEPLPAARRTDEPEVVRAIDSLVAEMGGTPGTLDARLVRELVQTALKLIPDGRDTGELKLFTNSVKELRYAHRIFAKYKDPHKVTIFGSARTPEDHPDYTACVDFSRLMAEAGWMSITGAGMGIMQAGHVGPGRDASFGVAIRLPFETSANPVIAGDEKLINFRYFFTRKLMFVSQAEAVALFPGGFGTLDEAFETLTLVQTGKSSPIPIVMVEGAGGDYWSSFHVWLKDQLLDRGWISPEDQSIYYLAKTAQDAVRHITEFYRNYHSSRYVRDTLVIRIKRTLTPAQLAALSKEFAVLIKSGVIEQRGILDEEGHEHPELPRLVFQHTRHKFGLVRRLIDRVNEMDGASRPGRA